MCTLHLQIVEESIYIWQAYGTPYICVRKNVYGGLHNIGENDDRSTTARTVKVGARRHFLI